MKNYANFFHKSEQTRRKFPPGSPRSYLLFRFGFIALATDLDASDVPGDDLDDHVGDCHNDDEGDDGLGIGFRELTKGGEVGRQLGGQPGKSLAETIAPEGEAGQSQSDDDGPDYDIPQRF